MTARPLSPAGPLALEQLSFENTFVRDLPADPVPTNVPRQVKEASYTRVEPTPVAAPKLLAWSDGLGEYLGISHPQEKTGLVAQILSGNKILPGMQPYAARYGGHQFGHWAGQLGDGRAITLGEIIATDGRRQELQLKGAGKTPYSRTADGRAVLRSSLREFLCSEAMHWLGVPTTRALSLVPTGVIVMRDMFYDGNRQELQLKVAGKTPYSRTADGRAVLRSSLREFLCSEAMHWLGVPTTRALSLVATGEIVIRDMFYDGNPEPEPGAVVCRVAPSFVRFGNFQIHAAHQELDALKRLADYVIREHY